MALFSCPLSVKVEVYQHTALLEYASPVWYLYSSGDIKKLKAVQRHTARWVCGSCWNPTQKCWSKSSDSCLSQLQWPSLRNRQKYFTIYQLHSIFNNHSSIPFNKYLSRSERHSWVNPFLLDMPTSTINPYQYSFFINSLFLWNTIPIN